MGIKYALYPQFLTWQEGGVGTQHKKYGHEVPWHCCGGQNMDFLLVFSTAIYKKAGKGYKKG